MTDEHTLHIDRLAYGGDGVARLADGRVAFVRGAAPDEEVRAAVVEEHPRFVRAVVSEVIAASSSRVQPPCPYFGKCGGCQWQHVDYSAQVESKRDAVVDALERIGSVTHARDLVRDPIASPLTFGYRNKVELSVTDSDRLELGFARAGNDEVIEIERCLLLPKRVDKAPRSAAGALRYLQGASNLGIRRVGIRVAQNTKDLEVAIWTAPSPFPRRMAAETLQSALKTSSVVRVIAKEAPRRGTSIEVLGGRGNWRERLAGFTFAISATSFFQVNTGVAELMVQAAVDALDPDLGDRVLDLFAGAGTFTLPLAERSDDVVAVEAEGSAVRDLRRNLERTGLFAEVIGGDAARELPQLGDFDLALVDPPRAGIATDALDALAATGARRIVYVSCDPPTLARDVARLSGQGYTLRWAQPFDLFPQTWHVETLALLERSGATTG